MVTDDPCCTSAMVLHGIHSPKETVLVVMFTEVKGHVDHMGELQASHPRLVVTWPDVESVNQL